MSVCGTVDGKMDAQYEQSRSASEDKIELSEKYADLKVQLCQNYGEDSVNFQSEDEEPGVHRAMLINTEHLQSKIRNSNSQMLKLYNLKHLNDKIAFISEDIALFTQDSDEQDTFLL